MSICSEPGCPAISTPPSPRCEEHTRARQSSTRSRYPRRTYGADWPKVRRAQLKREPDCRECGRPAQVVDHIIPIHLHPDRRTANQSLNLQSLCIPCHNRKTATIDSAFGRRS